MCCKVQLCQYIKGFHQMKRLIASALALSALLMAGCATPVQQPVSMKSEALTTKGVRVAVVMTSLPKVNTFFPGAGCLLCMATAELANSSLTAHTKTLTVEDLPTLKDQAADLLRKRGMDVTVVPDALDLDALPRFSAQGPNVAAKDFTSLGQKHRADKVLVIAIDTLGFSRPYSAYIPNGDPKAVLLGSGYLVDVKTNAYDWYTVADVARAANGNWDEGPSFPGLTNAYYQALELGKDVFLRPLAP